MRRIAFFPGSFDPITKGHEDIVRRALPMFDKIIVALGVNSSKNEMNVRYVHTYLIVHYK